jgi:serine/threonine protein kinase
MAEVYLAKCFGVAGFERLVALKRILPTIAEDDEFIAMFIDEAKIAGQLNHANIAQIFDLGKIESSYFIAMEYISGHDLRALWDRSRESGGLPLELCCYVTQKLCEGLDYAHRRRDNRGRPLGIIHRDVSPQNILLSYDGDIKVIDFGIAKAANRMVRTQTGILKGKFAYMAPEQARGDPTDHRADIFAIGVILYELITGQRAFKAESDFALLEKVRRVDIAAPRKLRSEVPRDLEKIIYKAMAREAADRYAWASALRSDLDRFMTDHGLAYNKEELGAYLRRAFRSEEAEEDRRLKLYEGFRPEGEGDDEDSLADAAPVRRAVEVSADNATVVRSDPSGEVGVSQLGTQVESDGPPRKRDAYGASAEVPSQVTPNSDGGFSDGYTLPIDELPAKVRRRAEQGAVSSDDEEHDTSTDHRRPGRDRLPWEDKSKGARAPNATQVNISRPDFSGEEGSDEDEEDETMVDSGPVGGDEDEPAKPLPNLRAGRDRREGARDDVRGTNLGQVLGTDDRPKRDEKLPATPHQPPRPTGRGNGATGRARLVSRAETESFQEPPPPVVQNLGVSPSRFVGFAVMAACVGVFLGIVLGMGAAGVMSAPSANTFIVVSPRTASVSLGDTRLCERTPCAVFLEPGRHELLFAAEGYNVVSKSVEIGEETNIVELAVQARRAGIRLETEPPGASVWLNGKKLEARTPVGLPELVLGDKVRLRLDLDGYETLQELVEVPDLGSAPWVFEMRAGQTEWTLSAQPKDAVIVIDGKARAVPMRLPVKLDETVVVSVQRPGCQPRTEAIRGSGKKKESRELSLACTPFDARLTVEAARRSQVEVDGVPLKQTTPVRELPIPAGQHVVVVKRRGKREAFTVDTPAGETFRLDTKFR